MNKEWIYKSPDPIKVEEISSTFKLSKTLATLLVNRNITDPKEIEYFLNPDIAKLHNAFLLPDLEKAVCRVRSALSAQEKILIFGDKDVDGVTALAILVRVLKSLGANVSWALPDPDRHGLSCSILDAQAKQGVKLIITVDCGTSNVEEIAYARTLGIDVIVTDHHLPPAKLPDAYAIVNPNMKQSNYPVKESAGSLVAFKFAYGLLFSFNRNFNCEFIVFDLETTGLSSDTDEIVEIGAVCVRNFVKLKEFHSLVRPTKPISAGAFAVNGITEEMVKDAPKITEVLPKLLQFIGERTIVAHNVNFDMGFLRTVVKKLMGRDLNLPTIDTLPLSRSLFTFNSHTLGSIAKELKIEMVQAHRSLSDCLATAQIFQRIEELRDPRLQFFFTDMLDLVTIGTIADVMPLVKENRTIVKHGLKTLTQTRKVGLKKLIEACGWNPKFAKEETVPSSITAKDVAWKVTPLLNAAGRLGRADLSVKLLLTNNEDEANLLVEQILKLNDSRKDLQKVNMEKFNSLIQEQANLEKDRILFLVASGIEHGVTGIVANRLMQEYHRPVVLLIAQGDQAMGSCRSIPNFNIVEALKSCEDILLRYGGHAAAAGLSVEMKNLEELRSRLKQYAQITIPSEIQTPPLEIDMDLNVKEIDHILLKELDLLEPFGEGNPQPLFSASDFYIKGQTLIGLDKTHLRLLLTGPSKSVTAIGWGMSNVAQQFKVGEALQCAFQLNGEQKYGDKSLQLFLIDFKSKGGNGL